MDRIKDLAGRGWRRYRGFPMWAQVLIGFLVLSVIVGPFVQDDDKEQKADTAAQVERSTTTTERRVQRTTTTKGTTTSKLTTTTAKPTTTTRAPDPEKTLRTKVSKELGKSNRDHVTRVTVTETEGSVLVTWAINENLTEGLTKDTARLEAVDILKGIRDAKVAVTEITLEGTYSLVDQLGNAEEERVVLARYPMDLVNQINFKNFNFKNVFKITPTPAYIHPAFQY